jgi:hypothetical protein
MIISDLTYLEIADRATALEGGNDVAASFTAFQQRLSMIQTQSSSTPLGSTAGSVTMNQSIGSFGLNFVSLQP